MQRLGSYGCAETSQPERDLTDTLRAGALGLIYLSHPCSPTLSSLGGNRAQSEPITELGADGRNILPIRHSLLFVRRSNPIPAHALRVKSIAQV